MAKQSLKGVLGLVGAASIAAATSSGDNGGPTMTLMEKVDNWCSRANSVANELHPLMIEVLEDVMTTRNATIAQQLQNGMPKAFRKREVAAWFAKYSPIHMFNEDNKTSNFQNCRLRDKDGGEHNDKKFYREWDIEGAKANPFFEKKEAVKELDPSKMSLERDMLQPIQTLLKSILGEEKGKPLAAGASITEAVAELKLRNQAYNRLAHMKMLPEMSGSVKDRIKKAVAMAEEQPTQAAA